MLRGLFEALLNNLAKLYWKAKRRGRRGIRLAKVIEN